MIFAVMQPLQAQIQAGKLRAMAVTTAKRFPLLPDLPSIAESGYPGFESLAWNGCSFPPARRRPSSPGSTPRSTPILKLPDSAENAGAGFDLVGGTPENSARS